MQAGQSSDRVFNVDGKLVLFSLLERFEPNYTLVDAVLDQETERLRYFKRDQYIRTWIDQRRKQLEEDGEIIINLAALSGG